jgi:hypothetical protein
MPMYGRGWAVRVVTALLAGAAVPVVTAGAAQAAVSGMDRVETEVTVPANTSYVVPMTCRSSGWTAVSGGWHIESSNHVKSLVIRQSRPSSGGGWTFIFSNTASVGQQLFARITCVRDLVDPLSVTSGNVSIPSGSTASAVATCPRGTRALGGGFSVNGFGHNQVVPLWSAPLVAQHGWVGHFRNNGVATTVTTYGVCGKVVNHYLEISTATVSPGEERKVYASPCTQEYVVSGGGWQHSFTAHSPLRNAIHYTDRVWRNTVTNSSSGSIQIATYAVCIRLA